MALINPVSISDSINSISLDAGRYISGSNTKLLSTSLNLSSRTAFSSLSSGSAVSNRLADAHDTTARIDQAISTVSAASKGASSLESLYIQASKLAEQALYSDESTRKDLATQYDSLLAQVDQVVEDSTYNGQNLLKSQNLSLVINDNYTMNISGADLSSTKLDVSKAGNNWLTLDDIKASMTDINGTVYTNAKITEQTDNISADLIKDSDSDSDTESTESTATESAETASEKSGALSSVRDGGRQFGTTISTLNTRKEMSASYENQLAQDSASRSVALDDVVVSSLAQRTQPAIPLSIAGANQQALLNIFRNG